MTHHPISIIALGLRFPHKTCFIDFSTQIHYGMRIAIIGHNGSGKTTLLKMLQGQVNDYTGKIIMPHNVCIGYVPQIIDTHNQLSGGQKFQVALTKALLRNPNVLLLDEPTNHLDDANRKSLINLINKFKGTVIVVTHDLEILRDCVDYLWHIDQSNLEIFKGNYDDYMQEIEHTRSSLYKELQSLNHQKKQAHIKLMKEQTRAKKSIVRGEKKRAQGHWPTLVAGDKERQAQQTTGKARIAIQEKRQNLIERMAKIRLPNVIRPTFSLQVGEINSSQTILCIKGGSCGYDRVILERIHLSLTSTGRLAITGKNGVGKTTLVKAILNDDTIIKEGEWILPDPKNIGYLDQQYASLLSHHTVLESLQKVVPHWTQFDYRRHLNDFLFRKNEEVFAHVTTLSGGEKARLCLAQLAAKTPRLLILDEITNNLDLQTRQHIIQVLQNYPGALIVISHDMNFLEEIGINEIYNLEIEGENK